MKEIEKDNTKREKLETVEDLETKEEKELIEWMKQNISSYETGYIYFVGKLKNEDVYISYKDDKYIPKYVKGRDFIYVIKKVTNKFNKMEEFRAVSATPKENEGKIEIYVFVEKESS